MNDPFPENPRSSAKVRKEIAQTLPFFLRAWWLRDRVRKNEPMFGEGSSYTFPGWSMHSDPICDAANTDYNT